MVERIGVHGPSPHFDGPESRLSRALEICWAHKAIFSSSVLKNGEVYVPETSCMKGTSVHNKNM